MIDTVNLGRAYTVLSEVHATERAITELQAGGGVQSLTVLGKLPEPIDQPQASQGEVTLPPNQQPTQPPTGGMVTLNNLQFPPDMLKGLAEFLQHRLQQLTSELTEMGIKYGAET